MIRPKHSREILRFGSHNIFRSLLGEGWYFRLRIRVSAYPLHNIPRSLLGEGWYFRLRIPVSAHPLHNIPRSLLWEEWYFRLRIRVSTSQYTYKFTWGGVVFSTAYPRIHFTIYQEVYLGRSGIFHCVSAYPRIHFTTYYLEVYLGRGGTFDCVSAYPAFSEVQLQNGRVFCSYSN